MRKFENNLILEACSVVSVSLCLRLSLFLKTYITQTNTYPLECASTIFFHLFFVAKALIPSNPASGF